MTSPKEESQLEWIQMKEDFDKMHGETAREKMGRKLKENPLVPVGCLATAAALSYGLWAFRRGEREMSQRMMRIRILAQGFTVAALVVGVGINFTKSSQK